jgi:hypothetical protein
MSAADPSVPLILFTILGIEGIEDEARQGGNPRHRPQKRGLEPDWEYGRSRSRKTEFERPTRSRRFRCIA